MRLSSRREVAFQSGGRGRWHARLLDVVPRKPGPRPDQAPIVELKSQPSVRLPTDRVDHLADVGIDIDKNVVSRVLGKHYRPAPGGIGPSWLSFIGHTTDSFWSVDVKNEDDTTRKSITHPRRPG